MDIQISIAAGAGPALGLMWYFDRLDAKRPEPQHALRRVTIAGAISVIPAGIIEYILMQSKWSFDALWMAPLVMAALAGFIEELAKVVCLRGFVWTRPEFDERMDGIVYATRAGLGFALVENILYLMSAKTLDGFLVLAVLRAVLAVPGHAIWAGMMGYFAARRRFDGKGPGFGGGYLLAATLHTAYDAAIFLAVAYSGKSDLVPLLYAVPVAIILFGGLALRLMAKAALHADDAAGLHAMQPPPYPPYPPPGPPMPPPAGPPGY